jgi:hypothetical protein
LPPRMTTRGSAPFAAADGKPIAVVFGGVPRSCHALSYS